jgi:glycosyltransferase involved in cell wall biosynthesis
MNDPPLISVLTVSLNQGPFIRQNIESVIAQDGEDWEHIVIDGGSTDETVSILTEYEHLDWVSEPDEGQTDALNKAIARSRGDIIFWINSDDLVAPGAFDAARTFFEEHPNAHIVCGNAVTIDEHGNEIGRTPPRLSAHKLRYPWNGDTSMHQPSIVFRRTVWEKIGSFDTRLKFAMDYDFFLRASNEFDFHHLATDFGLFRKYSGTKTGDTTEASFPEVSDSLIRFVQETDETRVRWTTVRAHFAQAHAWINDAVECYEGGNPSHARSLLLKACLRNPLSLVSIRHLYFRARQVLGPERFDAINARRKRSEKHHD